MKNISTVVLQKLIAEIDTYLQDAEVDSASVDELLDQLCLFDGTYEEICEQAKKELNSRK